MGAKPGADAPAGRSAGGPRSVFQYLVCRRPLERCRHDPLDREAEQLVRAGTDRWQGLQPDWRRGSGRLRARWLVPGLAAFGTPPCPRRANTRYPRKPKRSQRVSLPWMPVCGNWRTGTYPAGYSVGRATMERNASRFLVGIITPTPVPSRARVSVHELDALRPRHFEESAWEAQASLPPSNGEPSPTHS